MPLAIRSILVATDLTERTDPVIRAGSALSELTGAELHLLHAFDLRESPVDPSDAAPSFQGRIAQAEEAMEAQIRRALPASSRVASRVVRIYAAHRAILERAAQVAADLIVIGPHRSERIADRFLGATADRVVRTSAVPVLIVRGPLTLPLGTVLAPTDFSEPAQHALALAADWAEAFGPARLRVLHVSPASDGLVPPGGAVETELREESERARARAGGRIDVASEVRRSDSPAEEIVGAALDQGADLIAMGTQGHGAVERLLIGSVTSAVARHAPCAVLLVPPPVRR